ncbi:MAG: GntR family transcriptional regulator [Erysipelotrichaceae bacterium]|nr:GntR family transcriptional regulator [Erysipelotrichaceae bacterium]
MILNVDFSSDTPLYQQLRDQIVVGIAEGKLSPGEQLPTIRALAEESGINMMTVSKAYQLLKQEGYITTDRRSGARVAATGRVTVSDTVRKELKVRISELRLSGLSKEEILALCAQVYEEGETQ